MTTYYIDPTRPDDTGNGLTPATAKKTYQNLSGLNWGDSVLFKRGTTDRLTAYKTVANGSLVNGVPVITKYSTYYNADGTDDKTKPQPIITGGSAGIIWNLSGSSSRGYILIENLDFDGEFATGLYFAPQGMNFPILSNFTFRRCNFYRMLGSGFSLSNEESSTNGYITNCLIEDCNAYNNGTHGFMAHGSRNCIFRRCKAWKNGVSYSGSNVVDNGYYNSSTNTGSLNTTGAHGFSARYGRITPTFTLVSGTTYSYDMSQYTSTVYWANQPTFMVCDNTSIGYLVKNEITPSTPNAGEYGIVGNIIYINQGIAWTTGSVTLATVPCVNNIWENCESYNNVYDYRTDYHEGHGIALDDFASYNVVRNCVSHDNGGSGLSSNRGICNVFINNTIYNNAGPALGISAPAAAIPSRTQSITFANNVCYNNNARNYYSPLAEISVSPAMGNQFPMAIRDNILIGNTTYQSNMVSYPSNLSNAINNRIANYIDRQVPIGTKGTSYTNLVTNASLSGTLGVNLPTGWGHITNSTPATILPQEVVADKLVNVVRLIRNALGGFQGISFNTTGLQNGIYSFSFYVRVLPNQTPPTSVTLYFGSGQVAGSYASLSTSGGTIKSANGKWVRLVFNGALVKSNTWDVFSIVTSGGDGNTCEVALPQITASLDLYPPTLTTNTLTADLNSRIATYNIVDDIISTNGQRINELSRSSKRYKTKDRTKRSIR